MKNKITFEYPMEVYKHTNKYGTSYTMKLSQKNSKGNWITTFMKVQFRKDAVVEDRKKIYVLNAWLDFYIDKDEKPVYFIFINDFKTVTDTIEETKTKSQIIQEVMQSDPFEELGKEVIITDEDLPF